MLTKTKMKHDYHLYKKQMKKQGYSKTFIEANFIHSVFEFALDHGYTQVQAEEAACDAVDVIREAKEIKGWIYVGFCLAASAVMWILYLIN